MMNWQDEAKIKNIYDDKKTEETCDLRLLVQEMGGTGTLTINGVEYTTFDGEIKCTPKSMLTIIINPSGSMSVELDGETKAALSSIYMGCHHYLAVNWTL